MVAGERFSEEEVVVLDCLPANPFPWTWMVARGDDGEINAVGDTSFPTFPLIDFILL